MFYTEELVKRTEELKGRVQSHLFGNPLDEINGRRRAAVDEHNAMVADVDRQQAAMLSHLNDRIRAFNALGEQLKAFDRELKGRDLDRSDRDAVRRHNREVAERNRVLGEQQRLASEVDEEEAAFKARADQFEQEIERSRQRVAEIEQTAEADFEEYKRWFENDGKGRLYREVNQHFADLKAAHRDTGQGDKRLSDCIARIREIRMEMGRRKMAGEALDEKGPLVVPVTVGDEETLHMVVGTGGTMTSLTEELVAALGIEAHMGEEVEVRLPNDITIKAPQLTIPSITYDGSRTEYVQAVVLKEVSPGIDGCLGLSFLDRFNYSIESLDDEVRLSTAPRTYRRKDDGQKFDVFISHHQEDLSHAVKLYDFLKGAGFNPFLCKKTLHHVGKNTFHSAIEAAIAECEHLVVVCSSEACFTPWVDREWRLFDSKYLEEGHHGNVIPFLVNGMGAKDIPRGNLRLFDAVFEDEASWKTRLLGYLKSKTRVRNDEAGPRRAVSGPVGPPEAGGSPAHPNN
jgi:hypothetical protein